MPEHLSEDELGRFFRGEAPEEWPRILLHVTGCDFCRRRSLPWFELLSGQAADTSGTAPESLSTAYDASIDRAFSAVRRKTKKIDAERASLRKLLDDGEGKVERLKGWARVMALLERSFRLRYSDPRQMVEQAYLAYFAARHLDAAVYGPSVTADLKARAAAELANAERIVDNFTEAHRMFARAEEHYAQGTGDFLLMARILDLQASLAADERRFGEALELLATVRSIYEQVDDRHLAGRALAKYALFEGYQGYPERSVENYRHALALLDRSRDPQLFAAAQLNLLLFATESGAYTEAARLLFKSGLRQAFADDPLNLAKLRWVEAKVHAGLGRLDRAEHALTEARGMFLRHSLAYRAAIVGLDLAEVWMQQGGKLDEVSQMAADALKTFQQLGVGREAVWAARYLVEACKTGLVTAALVQYVSQFLTRFERDPNLSFVEPY